MSFISFLESTDNFEVENTEDDNGQNAWYKNFFEGCSINDPQPTHKQGVAHNVDSGVNRISPKISHIQLVHFVS